MVSLRCILCTSVGKKPCAKKICLIACFSVFVFFFNDTATTEIYTLSLHDALPICLRQFRLCFLGSFRRGCFKSGKDERSEEHTSELQSPCNLVCRLLLEKKTYNGNPADASQGGRELCVPYALSGGGRLLRDTRTRARAADRRRERFVYLFLFFFNDTATTETYTLSLHDALPIYGLTGPQESEVEEARSRASVFRLPTSDFCLRTDIAAVATAEREAIPQVGLSVSQARTFTTKAADLARQAATSAKRALPLRSGAAISRSADRRCAPDQWPRAPA